MTTVFIQAQPVDHWDSLKESTLFLARSAVARGFRVYVYQAENLRWDDGDIIVSAQEICFNKAEWSLKDSDFYSLWDADFIIIRTDPPFDMVYFSAMQLLMLLESKVLCINSPSAIIACPEKWVPLHFYQWMAPTFVGRSLPAAQDFRKRHGAVIVKELYNAASRGIFFFRPEDPNFTALLEERMALGSVIVQKYMPELMVTGDKRVLWLDGDIVGMFARHPQKGEVRACGALGAEIKETSLTDNEFDLCMQVGDFLKNKGVFFAGLDLIGGCLTEVNITSPAGIFWLHHLYKKGCEDQFWDAAEKKRQLLKGGRKV